jgi:type VI secretion system protein ImpC
MTPGTTTSLLAELFPDPALADRQGRALAALLPTLPPGHAHVDEAAVDLVIAECDRRIARQLDAILHAPPVQALEATWRGLARLIEGVDFGENIRVELLQCSKHDLRADFAEAPELPASGLYRIVYAQAIGTFGADPYGLLCADYEFGPGAEDLALLRQCATVAAMAHAPFITNAAPEFFGLADFAGLPRLRDLANALTGPRYRVWQAFRASEDARYVGLCLPRVLLRPAHDVDLDPTRPLPYRESTGRSLRDFLWGRASYEFALLAAASFARHRWCVHLLGSRAAAASDQLRWDYPSLPGLWHRSPLECTLSGRLEQALTEEGFVSLLYERSSGRARLLSAPSTQRPRTIVQSTAAERAALAGERLGAQLPYIFLVSRLAHYLKCVQRERVGSWLDRSALERELQQWLRQYVADQDDVQLEVRARRPLRRAAISVEAVDGQVGWYRCRLQLQPHLTHNSASFTLALFGKLDRPGGDLAS